MKIHSTWYEFLKADNKKCKKTYKKGGYKPKEPRGFKGSTYGAASEGKILSPEEKLKIQEDLKVRGII